MTRDNFINILIAEDNDVSRELMVSILKTQGYSTFGAIDGDSAIDVIEEHDINLALVDINMAPKGGFEFVKHLVVKGIDLPVVIVTGDDSSDMLLEANSLGVERVLQKPVDPDRLLKTIAHILKRRGLNPAPMAVAAHDSVLTPEQLMARAILLADKNAKSLQGGPFGAVVSDAQGHILGEGVNGLSARVDPTAHAEVMAIRQAAEKLGKPDLSDCVLYCSSEPTMMGQALIISVGIQKVYYGLSHSEITQAREKENKVRAELAKEKTEAAEYIQFQHDEALAMFQSWQAQDKKVAD